MARLVVVADKHIAISVAAAFDGIKADDGYISPESIKSNLSGVMKRIKGSLIKTSIHGEDAILVWRQEALVKFGKPPRLQPYELPYYNEIRYDVAEAWKDTISRQLQSNKEIKTITFALLPTMRASFFTHLLPSHFPGVEYTSVNLVSITREDIRRSFENEFRVSTAQTKTEYESDSCRKRITDMIRINLSAAMQEPMKRYIHVDQYILTALFMIQRRVLLKGSPRHRLQILLNVGDYSVSANSIFHYSEEEAEKIRKTFTGMVTHEGNYIQKLPTTATLYNMFDEFEFSRKDIDKASKSLYEKGFITCPYTMSGLLPENFTETDIKDLKNVCLSIHQEPVDEKLFDLLPYMRATMSLSPYDAIIPIRKDIQGLNEVETALYKSIVRTIIDTLKYNARKHEKFRCRDLNLIFQSEAKEEVTYPRGVSEHQCLQITSSPDGTFSPYSPGEFMQELSNYNIGTSEIIMTLLDRMIGAKLIFIDNHGIKLTDDGKKYCNRYSIDLFRDPSLCASWDRTLNKSRRNDFEDDEGQRLHALVDSIAENIEPWINSLMKSPSSTMATETTPKKHSNATKTRSGRSATQPAEKSNANSGEIDKPKKEPVKDGIPCPFCKERAMQNTDNTYTCSICGSTINCSMALDDTIYIVSDKDVISLAERGKTSLKFGMSHDGEVVDAGYLMMADGKISHTNRTPFPCPHCGQPLDVYEWGFACNGCSFFVPFDVYGVSIGKECVSALLQGRRTPPISGMRDNNGTMLPRLSIQIDNSGKIHFFKEENQ